MMATDTQRLERLEQRLIRLEQRVILLQQISDKQSELLTQIVEHLKK